MSFGTSVGDIVLLIQLAHRNYRNCKQAGGEYVEIAREVRSLHSVLKSLHDEAESKDSLLFQKDAPSKSQLSSTIEGCKGILEGIDALLLKYHSLASDTAETSKPKKLWHRMRFGAELDELGKFRWKIITYTSTLAVLLDSAHLKATDRVEKIAGRVEGRVESGFVEVLDRLEGFEDMRKAVLYIATKARSSQRHNAMESVLSLSTYADDDKEVWRQFRSQLVSLGFRSDSLDRHMEVLKAYMMRLDQTGVLDDSVARSSTSHQPWCRNASFLMTNQSLTGITEDGPSPLNKGDIQPPDLNTQSLEKEVTSWHAAVVKSDSTGDPEIATKHVDAEVQQGPTNFAPPKVIAPEILKNDNTQGSQSSTSNVNIPASSPIASPSGRRRIPRATVDDVWRTGKDKVRSGIKERTFSPARILGADDPPPYSEQRTTASPSTPQARRRARQRATDWEGVVRKMPKKEQAGESLINYQENRRSTEDQRPRRTYRDSRLEYRRASSVDDDSPERRKYPGSGRVHRTVHRIVRESKPSSTWKAATTAALLAGAAEAYRVREQRKLKSVGAAGIYSNDKNGNTFMGSFFRGLLDSSETDSEGISEWSSDESDSDDQSQRPSAMVSSGNKPIPAAPS